MSCLCNESMFNKWTNFLYVISDLASCDFSYGSCGYLVTGNDYSVKWVRGQVNGVPNNAIAGKT